MAPMDPPSSHRAAWSSWRKAAREFADQVKAQRRQRQMTAWALAEQCQLSLRIVEDLEHGFPVEQSALEGVCRNLALPVPPLGGDPVHTLALLIRQRREQARLRQYQLAALAGIAAKTLKELERGSHWPNPETCIGLLSVTALRLAPQDIAVFVPDPAAATERAGDLRASAAARVQAGQEMRTRAQTTQIEEFRPGQPESQNSSRPKPRLLFTFRVYGDGSMTFIPSAEPKRK
jgi:transcriptional regulator with XRE-family HTH domain